MALHTGTDEKIRQTLELYLNNNCHISKTAKQLGLSNTAVRYRLKKAGYIDENGKVDVPTQGISKPFEAPHLPSTDLSTEEIIANRKRKFQQVDAAREARRLIPIKIKIDGPIALLHMGDPHVDDDGTDIAKIERHIKTVNTTEGMFAANVGDLQNAWIGRLARLYAEQATTASEAIKLVEWLVTSTPWLYMVKGNHDLWMGAGDPLDWLMRAVGQGPCEPHGLRLELQFPNKRACRINARHDFNGHSMWNTAHGVSKAAQSGWRDHILTCGHTHVSGYQVVKDPSTGLISHCIRAASYKTHDRYALEKGLPDQNIFCAPVTIIDPSYADDDNRFVTTIFDPEEAAEFLTYKRKKWKSK